MPPLMLIIHMEKERAMRLSFVAMANGVRAKIVPDSDCGQTLGMLCGLDAPKSAKLSAPVTEEMLVFAAFPDDVLNNLLVGIRQSGLAPVRLKAVLTPSNRAWPLAMLQAELKNEAAAFTRMKEVKK